ncbi:phytanoyl-CoA dioxygenase family protein [Phenylobacterium sp.]|uniref:phytanoyl-CoA dioxygenase family protein n=1 Tax=Phenylobacterium sp. TaxID=1871053 RepID=UPI0025E7B29C|nr:phytanoyl-CoA dioxygenase family protein [Phenylobacterium sp.]
MKLSLDLPTFAARMEETGWVVFEAAVPADLVERMRAELEEAWDICRAIQVKNGVASDADRTVHHLVGLKPSFLEYVDASEPLEPYLEHYFQGRCILNSLGGAINTRGHTSYAQRIHRDIRSYSGDMPLLLNTLVMLDDFTPENGATYLMSGSHKRAEKPDDDAFYAVAERAVGPAGSILVFNSNVWHAGGNNTTDRVRRSVTPMYCKPFIKQQFDYPRAVGYDRGPELSAYTRQIVGYNARVPATLDEWYQPPERRMYKGDQG